MASKGKTQPWNTSTNQTWSSARAQLGIAVDVSPTGTTLTYEQIYTSGPTLEDALLTFLGETLSRYAALRKKSEHTPSFRAHSRFFKLQRELD